MIRVTVLLLCLLSIQSLFAQTRLAYHEFEADNISGIQLYGAFCDVEVSQDQKIRFSGKIDGYGRPGDFIISSAINGDGNLVIRVKHQRRNANRLSKAHIKFQVPQHIQLKIETTSGDIVGEQLITGNYEFKTSSGDIEMSDVIGPLFIETTSGDIVISKLRGDGVIRSTSGNKEIHDIQGKINVKATSGVTILTHVVGDVCLSSTSGNVFLKRIKGGVEVTATSANITAHQLYLTGNSKFQLINGNLKLAMDNSLNDLRLQMNTGSGGLNVNGEPFEREYNEGEGPIRVEGSTGSGQLDLYF